MFVYGTCAFVFLVLISSSRQFFSALGNEGLYKLLTPYDDKTATAICTFAFSEGPNSEPILFQGCTEGKIVERRGEGGFGMFNKTPRFLWIQYLMLS
jgi:inosine triphosphate pyrophosphatase